MFQLIEITVIQTDNFTEHLVLLGNWAPIENTTILSFDTCRGGENNINMIYALFIVVLFDGEARGSKSHRLANHPWNSLLQLHYFQYRKASRSVTYHFQK